MSEAERIELPKDYVPSEDEDFMNDRQKEYFRRKLMAWKDEILRESRSTISNLQEDMGCLLYTSPSPRDLSTSRMPSSA